ncbi:TatD DNase family protein [Gracilibacillus halotolerans]|uniref:TatD DNase family protein n=1 Tax=Gracilibacillus halotolerans TaxID=74386 RepID=A0A841RNQ0_9BACI|nr:TatD family hydrolase [Gracilibacillus halotolerans]MBB6513233.1 TatD DNase family protein [Gracilibacillus halotolerans]
MIDAHVHLDWYKKNEQTIILEDLADDKIDGLIAVSSDYNSCQRVLELAKENNKVYPALGWHPEQEPIQSLELTKILELIKERQSEIVAIGEIGLPYYLKKENPQLNSKMYEDILEEFLQVAKQCKLPVVLHAVYEDADTVIQLLDNHRIEKAHFHWFKGSETTMNKMIDRGYVISVTPDCIYEKEIQSIIKYYPLELLMVETDGPWPFEGPFQHQMTHPKMMKHSIAKIAEIKEKTIEEVSSVLLSVTKKFYRV